MYFRKAARCTFLYQARPLFPIMFRNIFVKYQRFKRIKYFCIALSDPILLLKNARHLESPSEAIKNYKEYVNEAFTEEIINRVCSQVEKDFRL